MEAAALGAKESGGSTIGVSLELYRPMNPNPWLDQEIVAETLFARLERLVSMADGYVGLRGGIGTLLELSLVWNLVQTPPYERRPFVVVGAEWARVFRAYEKNLALRPFEPGRVTRVDTVEDAVEYLAAHL
jgi:predicted Rossmann-fold nucleotide-binding protein